MDLFEHSQENIQNRLIDLYKKVHKDREELESIAKQKNLKITVDIAYSFRMLLYTVFPLIHLTGGPPHINSTMNTAAEEIFKIYQNPEYFLMKNIKVISIKDSKVKTTQESLRNLYKFKYVYNFELNYRILEEFKNGNVLIEFDLESMEYFNKAYYYKNPDTIKILNLINEGLKKDFKEFMRPRSANKYYFIYELAERNGINSRYLNHDLIVNSLC